MRKAVPFGALLLGLVLASTASADTTIKMKITNDVGSPKPRVSTGTMSLNADCMASRWDGEGAERARMIFRGDKDLMWVVNDARKSYQQIDKAFIDQVSGQMADANAQMKAQLEKMPPAQRAQMEAMMKKMGGGAPGAAAAKKLDYRKTAETRTINGQRCTKYETYWGDDLVSYMWVAPYSAMKLSAGDEAVFKKMADFMGRMTGSLGGPQKQDYLPMHELNGVPLLTQHLNHGKVDSETLIESVSHGPVAPGSFEVPAGYKVEAMPGAKTKERK